MVDKGLLDSHSPKLLPWQVKLHMAKAWGRWEPDRRLKLLVKLAK
jgi:hypothetical protein